MTFLDGVDGADGLYVFWIKKIANPELVIVVIIFTGKFLLLDLGKSGK